MGSETAPEGPSSDETATTVADARERASSGKGHNTWEFVIAIILSVATILSAWSGYESTRFGAKANRSYRNANTTMFHASIADANGQRAQMT